MKPTIDFWQSDDLWFFWLILVLNLIISNKCTSTSLLLLLIDNKLHPPLPPWTGVNDGRMLIKLCASSPLPAELHGCRKPTENQEFLQFTAMMRMNNANHQKVTTVSSVSLQLMIKTWHQSSPKDPNEMGQNALNTFIPLSLTDSNKGFSAPFPPERRKVQQKSFCCCLKLF